MAYLWRGNIRTAYASSPSVTPLILPLPFTLNAMIFALASLGFWNSTGYH